jgi:glycosyltransferase involved in cell wall biosynthesis
MEKGLSGAARVVDSPVVLVSVCIPTYNRRTLVLEAVASVLSQQGVDFEVIVVDDGSCDGTEDALRSAYGERVRFCRTENRGVAAARNTGVAASCGELISFLDSDDLWLPGKLAAQVRFFESNRAADICQTEEIWIRNGRRVNPRYRHRKPSGDIFAASLHLCLVSPSAVMLRRTTLHRSGGFDESLPACEDYDLWLRLTRQTPVWLVEEPYVIKRGGHPDQLSRRFWGMDRFRVASLARLLGEGAVPMAHRAAAVGVLRQRCRILAQGAERRGRVQEAERYRTLASLYEE